MIAHTGCTSTEGTTYSQDINWGCTCGATGCPYVCPPNVSYYQRNESNEPKKKKCKKPIIAHEPTLPKPVTKCINRRPKPLMYCKMMHSKSGYVAKRARQKIKNR